MIQFPDLVASDLLLFLAPVLPGAGEEVRGMRPLPLFVQLATRALPASNRGRVLLVLNHSSRDGTEKVHLADTG